MRKGALLLCPLFMFALSGAASGPEATVTSSEPFLLRGARVPVAGIPSWPVLRGDEITAGASAATLHFKDGSRVILWENSRARLEGAGKGLAFRLLQGTMQVKGAANSRTLFYALDTNVKPVGSRELTVNAPSGSGMRPAAVRAPPPPPGNPPPASSR